MASDRRDETNDATDASVHGSSRVFVNACGRCHRGTRRRHNQDQFMVAVLNRQLEILQTSFDRDSLLLCTDGLTRMLPDERIAELLCRETFANARCQALVEAANEAGGEHNITVLVASFDDFEARTRPRT